MDAAITETDGNQGGHLAPGTALDFAIPWDPNADADANADLTLDEVELTRVRKLVKMRSQQDAVNNMSSFSRNALHRADIHLIHSVRFELTDGDTLVCIDLPPQGQTDMLVDCDGVAYRSQTFLVHSQKLLATGSSKFAEMFSPTYQFRVKRRRKLVNSLPENVKYVIDLTPPSEGDELVFQMTELSLTPGIIGWWAAKKLHNVSGPLVLGHDDVCSCKADKATARGISWWSDQDQRKAWDEELDEPIAAESLSSTKPKSMQNNGPDGGDNFVFSVPPTPTELLVMKERTKRPELYHVPKFRRIPDYCPVRHFNGLIRLMMLIEGRDLLLNSAARVWTMVALAKIFDCISVVQSRVAEWLLNHNNSKFIEILPEEALQIGYALELPQITQSAFRILVNEQAIDDARQGDDYHDKRRVTLFGRRRGDCDDELRNMIQHGARALVERVTSIYRQFLDPEFLDHLGTAQWERFRKIEGLLEDEKDASEDPYLQQALSRIKRLKDALAFTMNQVFVRAERVDVDASQASYETMDSDRATYVDPEHFDRIKNTLREMNIIQRFLCPFIYHTLSTEVSGNIFARRSSRTPESFMVPFGSLLDEANNGMQIYMEQNQSKMASEPWKEALETIITVSPIFPLGRIELLDLHALEYQVEDALNPVTAAWVRHDIEPPLNISRHLLLTLSNNEMKFLPLWAGGKNDGTGTVFQSYVPLSDLGPNGPGPAFHTGITIPSSTSSLSGSVVDGIRGMEVRGSTVAGSVDVQDSISTVYNPNHVIADSVSIVSEAFKSEGTEFDEARFAVPADQQAMGQVLDSLVESSTMEHEFATDNVADDNDDNDDFGLDAASDSSSTVGALTDDEDVEMVRVQ